MARIHKRKNERNECKVCARHVISTNFNSGKHNKSGRKWSVRARKKAIGGNGEKKNNKFHVFLENILQHFIL